jgi:hypothetical protein
MKLQRLNNALHRDLGYLFVGMSLLYAISGIAINHYDDWEPSFIINKKEVKLNLPLKSDSISKEIVVKELNRIGESYGYADYDFPSDTKIKIYFKDGSLECDLDNGKGELERVQRRFFFYDINKMHKNPGGLWVWFSDLYALSLIFLAISGMFILKGKNGIKGRGKWFVGSGIVVILAFVVYVIYI